MDAVVDPPARPFALRSLQVAWSALKADPIGLLLPAAGLLLLELGGILAVREGARALPWPWLDVHPWLLWLGLAAAVRVGLFALAAPLQAVLLATGARAMGQRARGWTRVPSLLVVELVVRLLRALAWAAVGVPGLLLTAALLSQHAVTLAAVLLALTLLLGSFTSFVVRVWLVYAPYEAVLGGRGPIAAIRGGFALAGGDRLQLAAVLLLGDALTAIGGLLCGAGALPGYPMGPLAVLHRWTLAREAS